MNRRNNNATVMRADEVEKIGGAMITLAKVVVKKHPIKVSLYVIGLLICLFFQGFSVPDERIEKYEKALDETKVLGLRDAKLDFYDSQTHFYNSRGWFYSCNTDDCKSRRSDMEIKKKTYDSLLKQEAAIIANAKGNLGLFSIFGVAETKEMFWNKFARGKAFATRQSMWDMIFLGINTMSREEKFIDYCLKVVMNVLINFTIGVCMAVMTFMWNLWSIIQSFNASFFDGLLFYILASMAAISFGISWLLCFYFATAGTTYVAAKFIASSMRLEDGRRSRGESRFVQ